MTIAPTDRIQAQVRGGSLGGGFFCALGACIGLTAKEPQPEPIYWYHVFRVVTAFAAISFIALRTRSPLARRASILSCVALGLMFAGVAVSAMRHDCPPLAAFCGLLILVCIHALCFLLKPDVRAYFQRRGPEPPPSPK